jgi:hypothetical protein
MTYATTKKMGTINKTSGAIKAYRADAADLTTACTAAAHYAKRDNEIMVVYPGNSYGAFLYRLTVDVIQANANF